jgi:hypothetical protein
MEQSGHEWLKEEFKNFWKNIDVEKYQPIPLSKETRSEEDLKIAKSLLKKVEEHNRQYYDSKGLEYKTGELFSK